MALPSLRDFTSGVGQGWNTGQQMFDAGVAGLARAAGYKDVARDWERSADEQAVEAQRYANPATQVAPWREGGGGWENAAPWLVNQAGQLIGGAAPLVAGGAAGMALAPVLPEAAAGLAAGAGMGLASYPQAVGANYQAARDANQAQGLGEVTPEQAQSAAAWGVPSAALNAFAPTRAIGIGETAASAVSRTMLDAAKGVAKTGVDNALATAGQKAIEHSFRPDMSDADKTRDMLDSVVTGFIGGAGMGAAGEGIGRIVKAIRPDTPTADLDAGTKSILEPEKAAQDAAAAARPQYVEGNVSFLNEGKAPAREVGPIGRFLRDETGALKIGEEEKPFEETTYRAKDGRLFSVRKVEDEFHAIDEGGNFIGRSHDASGATKDKPSFTDISISNPEWMGQGVGSALYAASRESANGHLAPSGNLSNDALAWWKRNDPSALYYRLGDASDYGVKSAIESFGSKEKAIIGIEKRLKYLREDAKNDDPEGHYDWDIMQEESRLARLKGQDFKPDWVDQSKKPFVPERVNRQIPTDVQEAKSAAFKQTSVKEPQRFHSFLQQMGGVYETPETRGILEQFAPVDDRTRNNARGEILHAAEPLERRVVAKPGEGVDIQEATKRAIDAGFLPEDATPSEFVDLLHRNQDQPVYSSADEHEGLTYQAQRQAKQLDETIKSNRAELKNSFGDQPKEIRDEAAHFMATGEYTPEEAIQAAKDAKAQRERDLTPAVEGFADSAFSEPAEGVDTEGWRSKSPKQFLVEAKKLWEGGPDDLDLAAAKYESEGDTARASVYRQYQAEQLAKAKPIVRDVGGAKAMFRRTPRGLERVATPDDAKQPVDRPAGTPPVEGPLGVAPGVPPLPPREAIPPKPDAVPGGGGGGDPPKPPASGGGSGGEPPERPRIPIDVKAPKDIDGRLARFLNAVDFGSLGDTARKLGLYVTTNHHHDEMYGHIMPSQLIYSKAVAFKAALSQRMQAHGMARQAELRQFARENSKIAQDTMKLERAYQLGINPAKEWAEQSQRIREGDKHGTYEAEHKKYKEIYDRLSKQAGGLDMHNSIREQYDTHWTSKPSAVLYTVLNDLTDLPDELKAQIVDPSEALINDPDVARTPSQSNRVFADALKNNLEIAKAYLDAQDKVKNSRLAKANPDKYAILSDVKNPLPEGEELLQVKGAKPKLQKSALRDLVREIETQKGKLKDVPYSALVRSGKYGIGFRLAVENGIVKPDAIQRIRESVKKAGFDNVVIEPLADSDYVFIRSDNSTKVNNLKNLLVKNHLADIQNKDFEAGTMDVFSKSPAASKTINNLISQIEADDKYKPHEGDSEEMIKSREMRKKQMVSALRELSIDFLPEASMEKYSARREYIPGFEADPLQAMAKQSIENAQQVSGLLGTYRVQKALGEQLREWEASKNPLKADGTPNEKNQYEPIMAALYGRNMGKEEYSGMKLGGSLFDAAQSLNYSYYLGFNPSFGIIQMSQIPMYVIPELGKRYGFMKAATAIGNTFTPSMKIVKAVMQEAMKAGNGALADMPITVEALTKAGLDDETARYMVHMVNRGGIDTGGLARSLGHIAENRTGGKLDKFTRWASAIGYYGETLSRIQTALAAKEVFKNAKNKDGTPKYDLSNPEHWNKLIDESHRVLDEALFDYSQENRATGFSDDPRSLLGRGTKLAFAFQAYWMMAIEKQYRELHRLFTDADPAAKKEAAKFLLGHLAATSLIAGSLGIPGMSAFQKAYEKFEDWRDPEDGPHDMREDYSTWLEHTLGSDIGDAVAYGAPRLIGQDWSKRTGEQDFAPIPTFLYDRGSWKDAFNKWALAKEGPAQGAFANIMTAIDKFNAGDLTGATASILPAAGLRNALNTAQVISSGHYRDSRGHTIPNVEPTTGGIISGFAGFTPKNLAREREENAMLHRYDNSIEYEARNIVAPMVDALRDGDKVSFNRMLPKAREFERMHPGHKIVDRAQETFKREYKELNTAEKTGMPYQRWKDDPKRKERAGRYVDAIKDERGY